MDRFTALSNRLKEIILATKLASQPLADKQKEVTPQEPQK